MSDTFSVGQQVIIDYAVNNMPGMTREATIISAQVIEGVNVYRLRDRWGYEMSAPQHALRITAAQPATPPASGDSDGGGANAK